MSMKIVSAQQDAPRLKGKQRKTTKLTAKEMALQVLGVEVTGDSERN